LFTTSHNTKTKDENGEVYGDTDLGCLADGKRAQQFENVIKLLERRPTTRKAILQLFDSGDLNGRHKDVPCTCTLQFLQRGGKLDLIVYMRSNDAVKGFPHDTFCFTMLQEIAARALALDLGSYKHCVGSFHLYDTDIDNATAFLAERLSVYQEYDASYALGRSQTLD